MNIQTASRHALETRLTALTALLNALKGLQAIGDYSQVTAFYDTMRDIDAVQNEILTRVRSKGESLRHEMRDIEATIRLLHPATKGESLRDAWNCLKSDYDCKMSELRYLIGQFTNA